MTDKLLNFDTYCTFRSKPAVRGILFHSRICLFIQTVVAKFYITHKFKCVWEVGEYILGVDGGRFGCEGGNEEDLLPSGDRLLWGLSKEGALSALLWPFASPVRLSTALPGCSVSLSACVYDWSWRSSLFRRSTKPTVVFWLVIPAEIK